jgi:hypothetical protein
MAFYTLRTPTPASKPIIPGFGYLGQLYQCEIFVVQRLRVPELYGHELVRG